MPFVPLHVYSGYSFEKSGLKIDQYVKAAKKIGYTALGLSDFASLSGMPIFVHECEQNNIKPIVAEDFYFDNLLFTFVVLNEVGYRNLLQLNYQNSQGKLNLRFLKEHNVGLATILTIQNDAIKKAYLTLPDPLPLTPP